MSFTELYSMIKIIGIHQKRQTGPRTETYGMPYIREALLDTWQLMETNYFLSKR